SGEYYRSFTEKKDYYHIFDYWRWDEKVIDDTLFNVYDWEKAIDTSTTWRIGDGTAAFYNYVYYTVAGFTEHDTFRSNQIREGDLTRDEALKLVAEENKPRYPNIRWYLDTLGLDFKEVISVVNKIPKLYQYK
ncbi:glucosamine 6-phosphate synthetase, partial [Vibrio paracholerae]|nr:glucosamine 6-phosphate synthetase [Vibrio paracholerae]